MIRTYGAYRCFATIMIKFAVRQLCKHIGSLALIISTPDQLIHAFQLVSLSNLSFDSHVIQGQFCNISCKKSSLTAFFYTIRHGRYITFCILGIADGDVLHVDLLDLLLRKSVKISCCHMAVGAIHIFSG